MEDSFSGLAEPYLATGGTLRGVIRHTLVADSSANTCRAYRLGSSISVAERGIRLYRSPGKATR
jgi:hypothetical protein